MRKARIVTYSLLILGVLTSLILISSEEDETSENIEKMSIKLAKAGHLKAIGSVFAGKGPNDPYAMYGTGTYVGDNRVITAAHVVSNLYFIDSTDGSLLFQDYTGPFVFDVSNLDVFWSPVNSLKKGDQYNNAYKVLTVTVDVEFLKRSYLGKEFITDMETVADIAVLTLEETPEIKPIPVAERVEKLPEVGVLIGFGKRENERFDGKKHALVQTVEEELVVKGVENLIPGEWNMLLSDVLIDDLPKLVQQDPTKVSSLQNIFGLTKLEAENIIIALATNGDSGGPLLVYDTRRQQVKIIGVLSSASDNGYNEYASLMTDKNDIYIQNPEFADLWRASKGTKNPKAGAQAGSRGFVSGQ